MKLVGDLGPACLGLPKRRLPTKLILQRSVSALCPIQVGQNSKNSDLIMPEHQNERAGNIQGPNQRQESRGWR